MISQQVINSTPSTFFTAGGTGSALLMIGFCNMGSTASTLNLWVMQNGVANNDDTNKLIHNYTVPAGDTFFMSSNDKLLLGAGDKLVASASSNLTTTVSYANI